MGSRNQRLELTWYNKDKALIPASAGKYGYTWVSPRDPRYCETHTLVMDETVVGEQAPLDADLTYSDNANLEPTDDNLLILGESGDVLEALTRVPELADKYAGQVKCIYIDPPFNTQKAFPEASYEDNLEHSIWLTMMRDRLRNARRLLHQQGTIWVHLDHSENHRMRVLLDEIFGPANFLGEFVWQKADSPRGDSNGVSVDHDVILAYRKSGKATLNRELRTEEDNDRFSNPDGDSLGPWFSDNKTAPLAQERGYFAGLQHPITGEMHYPAGTRHWVFSQERILRSLEQWASYRVEKPSPERIGERARRMGIPANQVRADMYDIVLDVPLKDAQKTARARRAKGNWTEFFVTEESFARKAYPPERGQPPRTWWTNESVGHNREAKTENKNLFPGLPPFTTPKPERLIERILNIATTPGDLVLDFFAGSGTTAAVAHKMGRRWITCELVEDTFNRYTKKRLVNVVLGQDMGGISTIAGERIDATANGLPEGLTPDDAMRLTSLLNKAVKDEDELKNSATLKALKALVKTKKTPVIVNWRGGGAFKVAHLSPSCFDYDEELQFTMLTDAVADDETLIRSVAAQMGFYLTPEHPVFHGVKGSMRLHVTRTPISADLAAEIADNLEPGERVTIASTSVLDGGRKVLREKSKGSRVVHIPDDLFSVDEEGNF